MTSDPTHDERPATTERVAACVVALLIVAGGAVVIVDSLRLGMRWVSDGPQAGYFPFYIGVTLCISGAVNFFGALRAPYNKTFVTKGQARLVLLVLLPLIVYVGAIQLLGIYVASTIYIAIFMTWLGKYKWKRTALVSLGVSIAFFLLFEVWFKVPLIKGPLEAALGLN